MTPDTRYAMQVALFAAVYTVVAKLGLQLDAVSGFATLVWAPTGISLAVLLKCGLRFWPGIALGAVITNVWTGAPLTVALGIGFGNTLEAVAGAYALKRFAQLDLSRLRDVVALVTLAAGLSTLLSATIGVSSLIAGGVVPSAKLGVTWRAWWLGDAVGDLVVAPALLTWSWPSRETGWVRRIAEAVVLGLSLLAMSMFIFALPRTAGGALSAVRQPHFLLPLLIWSALRLGPRGAASSVLVVSAVAIWGVVRGNGPFVGSSFHESLATLQAYMAMIAVTSLSVGAAAAQRRRAERDNARLYQEAQKALELRDEILSIVSHDLKNPLGVILLNESALLQGPATDSRGQQLHKHARTVRRAAERMRRLIDDLADFASMQAGQLCLQRDAHDPALIVKEAAEAFTVAAQEAKINLRWQLQPNLPSVDCDRGRILQVLTNLLANALHVTGPGGSISVGVDAGGDELVFSVTDTGHGIRTDDLPRVFERYFRAAGTSYRGTGLGLAIVKGVVEAHGGRIWVQSQLGTGSAFCFSLSAADGTPSRKGGGDDRAWKLGRSAAVESV